MPARPTASPLKTPAPRVGVRSGFLVAVLALLAVLPLLPHLGRRAAGVAVPGHAGVGPMEAATLGLPRAESALHSPPPRVAPAAAWWPGDAAVATPRALGPRLLSVLMVGLAVAGACRAGSQLGGTRAGLLAGATLLGSPALWAWGRAATPASMQMAASLLAVAGALTAIRPFKPQARVGRLATGWTLAGVGFAGAALAGGAAAAIPPAAAVIVLVALSPRRLGDAAGLLAAGCLGVLLVLPWLLPAEATGASVASLFPDVPTGGAGGYGALALDLGRALGPWLPLVVCAAVLPFTGQVKRQGTAGRLIHGWSLAVVGLAACLPLAGGWAGPGATLFAAAACSVAVGQALSAMAEAAETGRRMWLWRVVSIVTVAGLLMVSLVLGWSAQLAAWPLAAAWMPPLAEAGGVSLPGAILLAVLAGVVALAAAVPAWGDRPAWAAAAIAAWAWLVLLALAVAGGGSGVSAVVGVPA